MINVYKCLILLLFSINANAIARDKQMHFGVSTLTTVGATAALQENGMSKGNALLLGSGASILLGILKEVTDSHYDQADMLANAMGVSAGMIFVSIAL